jgi:hypothetical protein
LTGWEWHVDGGVTAAVQRDLLALPAEFRETATALAALALAESIDHPKAAMAMAPMVKELRECLSDLRALAPPVVEGDVVDDLASARAARRSAAAAG